MVIVKVITITMITVTVNSNSVMTDNNCNNVIVNSKCDNDSKCKRKSNSRGETDCNDNGQDNSKSNQ